MMAMAPAAIAFCIMAVGTLSVLTSKALCKACSNDEPSEESKEQAGDKESAEFWGSEARGGGTTPSDYGRPRDRDLH
jgi:hypothetical protein